MFLASSTATTVISHEERYLVRTSSGPHPRLEAGHNHQPAALGSSTLIGVGWIPLYPTIDDSWLKVALKEALLRKFEACR
jgi:hypothetical protein